MTTIDILAKFLEMYPQFHEQICQYAPAGFNCFMTYTNGVFYNEQCETGWHILIKKLRKILAIIFNKDYYYAEMTMTKAEFDIFREYINSVR